MARFLKRLGWVVFVPLAALALSAAIAIGGIELRCAPEGVTAASGDGLAIEQPGYRRQAANTYLTFPEWYIVYSYEDFGAFLETGNESAFPYFSQIAGFWKSYCVANRLAMSHPGDHGTYKLMINVIGLSYSWEYATKGLYENTVGRLTEWLRGPERQPEDILARDFWQDYGKFLNQVPWYRYPFGERLNELWSGTPLIGAAPVRNIERKLSLSAEYLFKAGYAQLIAMGLEATTAPADLEIMFVVATPPEPILEAEPDVRLVSRLPDGMTLLIAPRYRRFTHLLMRLSESDTEIVEIAGNRRILMSAVLSDGLLPEVPGARELFSLPIDARPGYRRVGFDVDVLSLSATLKAFVAAGVEVEHLYDY